MIKDAMKLNGELAIGESGTGWLLFAYFDDVDGIRKNTRAGSVFLDEDAIKALRLYLEFDDGKTPVTLLEVNDGLGINSIDSGDLGHRRT